MTSDQILWSRTRDDLVRTIVSLGFPAELGEAIAKHLGSPRATWGRFFCHHYDRSVEDRRFCSNYVFSPAGCTSEVFSNR